MNLKTLAFAAAALIAASPAQSADASSLPAEETQGNVRYVTGGVGEDAIAAFKQAAPKYSLELQFVQKATPRDEFLSDVKVTIRDGSGKVLLDATSKGPFLLAQLPTGKYQIDAAYEGVSKRHSAAVQSGKHARAVLVWSGPNDMNKSMQGDAKK